MKNTDDSEEYRPWATDFRISYFGLAVAALALIYFYLTGKQNYVSLGVAAFGFLLWAALTQKGLRRIRGKRIEEKAVRSIDWELWESSSSVPCAGGDIDLVLRNLENGNSFAVEIKSLDYVRHKKSLLGKDVLVDRQGRKFRKDPAAQALRNAELIDATPVLWLPLMKTGFFSSSSFTMKSGLIVVMGAQRNLRRRLEKVR